MVVSEFDSHSGHMYPQEIASMFMLAVIVATLIHFDIGTKKDEE